MSVYRRPPARPARRLWIGSFSPDQILVPTADSVDGSWTNEADSQTNLFASIDETTLNTADYIKSELLAVGNSTCRVKLATGGDPSSSDGHQIEWTIDKIGTLQVDLTVVLRQGGGDSAGAGTSIASFPHSDISSSTTSLVEVLNQAQADLITNYGDLYLEFVPAQAGGWS